MIKRIYMAPMEGITGYIFRNAHARCFPGIEAYYTPFLAPHRQRDLKGKEIKDVLPENNTDISVIPQILTNQPEDFVRTAGMLKEMGYHQVDFNLGCPSGTVVAKKKGAGFLEDPEKLNSFFEKIFEALSSEMKISVKTRIGLNDAEEFSKLLKIFNQYPIEMLTIHPRLQKDYYNNFPDLEVFRYAVENSRNPICYNGDLFHQKKIAEFEQKFPEQKDIMIGRGLLKNPALHMNLPEEDLREQLIIFHDMLLEEYQKAFSGDRPVLFKMKEWWFYLGTLFEDSEKLLKKIKKAQSVKEYENIAKMTLCKPIKEK